MENETEGKNEPSSINWEIVNFLVNPRRNWDAVCQFLRSEPAWTVTVECRGCKTHASKESASEPLLEDLRKIREGNSYLCEKCLALGSANALFIGGFLTPANSDVFSGALVDYGSYFDDMRTEWNKTDKGKIINFIRGLDYNVFLNTAYWKIIAGYVRLKKGHFCALCPAETGLETHHRHYANHGREIEVWETDLTILCDKCHKVFHRHEGPPPPRRPRDNPKI